MAKIVAVDEIRSRLDLVHAGNVDIIDLSYTGSSKKATFIDKDFGAWHAYVHNVTRGHCHPSRAKNNARLTCMKRYGSLTPLSKGIVRIKFEKDHLLLHGVSNPMQRTDIKNKVKSTLMKNFGVDNAQKSPEIRRKTDRSRRHKKVFYNWKTNDEVVTVGSYESSVVAWLNDNKIEYIWQPSFVIPRNHSLGGRVYFIDMQILSGEFAGKFIEIKGAWIRPMQKQKWDWFKSIHNDNAILWYLSDLKKLGIM
jgi:hypothetical protein